MRIVFIVFSLRFCFYQMLISHNLSGAWPFQSLTSIFISVLLRNKVHSVVSITNENKAFFPYSSIRMIDRMNMMTVKLKFQFKLTTDTLKCFRFNKGNCVKAFNLFYFGIHHLFKAQKLIIFQGFEKNAFFSIQCYVKRNANKTCF